MTEKESFKEQEASAPVINLYEAANMAQIKERNSRVARGRKVIKGKYIPWEQNRQGLIRWYVNDIITDTANDRWTLIVHEIRMHSGKHTAQGGTIIFVLKGKGYSVFDGVRLDWGEGDLLCMPIKVGGVEHQHFNLDGRPSRWLALINNRVIEFVGRFLEQKENAPDWVKLQKKE